MSDFFLSIVNMSISASWIVLAVLILRLLLKKAPKWITVLLWGIVAIRLICPFSIESVMSLIPSAETISPEIMMENTPAINSGVTIINNIVNPIIGESFAPDPSTSANPLQIVVPILSIVWITGIAIMLAYTVISYFRVKSKIGTAVLLRDNIYQSENVVSPFVLGIIKPKIYLPFNMNDQNMEHVIAHENAHIRRKDHLWKPFRFLVLTLHWFNPLMWLGYVLLCRDIELACDEKVVKEFDNEQKANYSQALLTCSVNRRVIAACPLAFGEVDVRNRVKSVLNYKKPAFWIVIAAIIVSIIVTVCFLTNPRTTLYVGGPTNIGKLKEKYPQFFNVSTDGGLTVYIWQMSENNYSCYLANTSIEAISDNSFVYNVGTTIAEMRAILTTYDIEQKDITVQPVINPLSSYYYEIDDTYRAKVKELFWKDSYNVIDYDGSSIPKLNVTCGNASTEASMGTTEWTSDAGNGKMKTVNGDSSHPLETMDYLLPLALKVNRSDNATPIVGLNFNVAPDSIKVNSWFVGDNGNTKSFDAEVDGFNIKLNAGKETCVYEVVATWNKSSKYYGTVRYSFCVVESEEANVQTSSTYDEWGLKMDILFKSATEFDAVFNHDSSKMTVKGSLTTDPEFEIKAIHNGKVITFGEYMRNVLHYDYADPEFAWDTVLYTIAQNKETSIDQYLLGTYGNLPVGQYLLCKNVTLTTASGDRKTKVYTADFAITD